MFRILMTRLSSKGTCSFCGGSFAKSSMARHLNACEARAKENEKPSVKGAAKGGAKRKILHLQVNARNSPMYWIHIEIPENATLEDLDDFLRLFWLECCSHLSSFEIEGCSFFSERFEQEDRSMKISLGMVIAPGMEFEHIYDFGTSTELSLKVLSAREGLAQGKAVKVMARNEPPSDARAAANQPQRFAASASARAQAGCAMSVLENMSAERICSCPWSTLLGSGCAPAPAGPTIKTAEAKNSWNSWNN